MELINQINLVSNDLIVTTLANTQTITDLLEDKEHVYVVKSVEQLQGAKTQLLIERSKQDNKNSYYLVLDVSDNNFDEQVVEYFNKNFIGNTFSRVLLVSHKQLNQKLNFLFDYTFVSFSVNEYSLDNLW